MEGKCRVYAGGIGNVLSRGGGASGVEWESIDNLSKSQGGRNLDVRNVPLLAASS